MLALLTVHKTTIVYLKNQYMILKTIYTYLFSEELLFFAPQNAATVFLDSDKC